MLAVQAIKFIWAINSEGECLLDVEKVIGSNPILPTNLKKYAICVDFIELTQFDTKI